MIKPDKIFDCSYSLMAEKLCRMGATDKELSDFFEISIEDLNAWQTDQPEFAEALMRGRLVADANVADSLYRRATGHVHDEYDVRVVDKKIETTAVKKYYPPDPAAIKFYLKNRQPRKWKDKVEEPPEKAKAERIIVIEPVERPWQKNQAKSEP